jgi:hypothetical protein
LDGSAAEKILDRHRLQVGDDPLAGGHLGQRGDRKDFQAPVGELIHQQPFAAPRHGRHRQQDLADVLTLDQPGQPQGRVDGHVLEGPPLQALIVIKEADDAEAGVVAQGPAADPCRRHRRRR